MDIRLISLTPTLLKVKQPFSVVREAKVRDAATNSGKRFAGRRTIECHKNRRKKSLGIIETPSLVLRDTLKYY